MRNYLIVRYILATFMGMILSHTTYAVRINGQEITLIGVEGKISYEAGPNGTNIAFTIQGDDINVGSIDDSTLVSQTIEIYNELDGQKQQMAQMVSGKSMNLQSGTGNVHHGAFLKAGEDILLSGGTLIDFDNVIAETGAKAIFTAPKIQTKNFYLSAKDEVHFKAPIENRKWLAGIQYEPSTSLGLPFSYFFEGDLQLSDPSTDGNFLAIGARKVTFNIMKI